MTLRRDYPITLFSHGKKYSAICADDILTARFKCTGVLFR